MMRANAELPWHTPNPRSRGDDPPRQKPKKPKQAPAGNSATKAAQKWLNGMYSAALLPTSFNQDTFLEKACEDGGFSVQAARAYVEECGRVQKLTPRSC